MLKKRGSIVIAGLVGFVIGIVSVWIYFNYKSINWTATSCFVAVVVLIVTTYENRRRFEQDWNTRLRVSDADKLIDLISQYIGSYQSCQTVSCDILIRKSKFIDQADFTSKISAKADTRNDLILNMSSITSQIEMLEIRILKEISNKSLFDDIKKVNDEINRFYRKNLLVLANKKLDNQSIEKIIKENCEHQNEIVKENIRNIQEKSAQVYQELIAIKR